MMNKDDFDKAALTKYAEERYNNIVSENLRDLTIRTYVSSKWRFIDLETNTVWKYEDGEFLKDKSTIKV